VVQLGDIWKIHFPYGDKPDFKERPVVVVGASPMGHREDHVVLVVMVTSQMHQKRNGDVIIASHSAVGLSRPSVIKARRLYSATPQMFQRTESAWLGRLDATTLKLVLDEIAILFSP
jgi:mRNA-degrading endonuclease toxin of MazEF toxin-antitoxin module